MFRRVDDSGEHLVVNNSFCCVSFLCPKRRDSVKSFNVSGAYATEEEANKYAVEKGAHVGDVGNVYERKVDNAKNDLIERAELNAIMGLFGIM